MSTVCYRMCTKYKVYIHVMQQGDTYLLLYVMQWLMLMPALVICYNVQSSYVVLRARMLDCTATNCECTAKVQEDTVAAVK